MASDNDNGVLQNESPDDNMQAKDEQHSAGDSTPEDTLRAYEETISKLAEQNQQLIDSQKSLQDQISVLIRGGAAVNHAQQSQPDPDPDPEPEPYVSLADLGAELGTREYKTSTVRSK